VRITWHRTNSQNGQLALDSRPSHQESNTTGIYLILLINYRLVESSSDSLYEAKFRIKVWPVKLDNANFVEQCLGAA